LFELIGEGVVQPTAEQVAERAGVQPRTVFRHFADMESLHTEVASRLLQQVLPFPPVDAGAPLATRMDALVARRAAVFDRITPYKLTADSQRWRYEFLQAEHERMIRELRADLFDVLPEIREADDGLQAAAELVTSFEAWNRLRTDQRLSSERAQAAIRLALRCLIPLP
jgi:AcrR family transcriptional regulator